MKASFVVCLVFTTLCGVSCKIFQLDAKPAIATDLLIPVGVNTLNLQMPYCYFENMSSIFCNNTYTVWLVCSLTSAKSNYEANKETDFKSKYPGTFSRKGNKYFTVDIDDLENIPCPAEPPYNYLVGEEGVCTEDYCNGQFPDGEVVSCKYTLVDGNGKIFAETQWSDNINLRPRRHVDSLSTNTELSATMMIISAILGFAVALLFLLLLIALIHVCLYPKEKTQSKQKFSKSGSFCIPGYKMHHLKNTCF